MRPCSVPQDNDSSDVGDLASLIQEVECYSPAASVLSNTSVTEIDVSPLTAQIPQDLCVGYGYSIDFETISEVCDYNFFQGYAGKCGYQLTEDFLSAINKHKIKLVREISSVLGAGFSFLKNFKPRERFADELMDKVCSSFSRAVYDLRPKCIDFLQSYVIPATIRSIYSFNVIDGKLERRMTYPEMEQFFLYYATTLERLIMAKIINYWEDFCDSNGFFLSLLSPGVDYSNPFDRAYCSYGITTPHIDYPAAFLCMFGSCLSFLAIDKIEDMMDDFVSKFVEELKSVVRCKCAYICGYSNNACDDIKVLRGELNVLIKKEFYKKVREEKVKDDIVNFLGELIIWNHHSKTIERNRLLIFESIINNVYESLASGLIRDLRNIFKYFQCKLTKSMKCMSRVGNLHIVIENKFMLKLHPEDSYNIFSIRNKFFAKYIEAIRGKFHTMLKEEYKFPDGTVVGMVDWDEISKNMLPVAERAVSSILNEEYLCLSEVLSNARVVDDIGESFTRIRNVTSEERDSIFKFAIHNVDQQMGELFKKIWIDLIDNKEINFSKDDGYDYKDIKCERGVVSVDDVGSVSFPQLEGGDILVSTCSEQGELPLVASFPVDDLDLFSSAARVDKIFNTWGLNLHPDDDRLVLVVRKKFSSKIRKHVRELFSNMLDSNTLLSSGKVLRKCSWPLVSNELYPIALESVGPILDEQYLELDRILSESRVVDVVAHDISSCTVREVTDDEKNNLMVSSRKLVCRRLVHSFRLSWLEVTECSRSAGYGYKEISDDLDTGAIEGSWGVRLCYSDNIAILSARRRFSSEIIVCIRNKFHEMIKNRYVFDDGTVIGRVAWFRVSRKLFPIAKEEVKNILEDESKELEKIICRSRVLVDSGVYRELTDEEKRIVLENVMKLVYKKLKPLLSSAWANVIASLHRSSVEEGGIFASDDLFLPSVDFINIGKVNTGFTEDVWGVMLRYEDDIAILNVRRKFSSEISRRVRSKFIEIKKKGYKSDDGTTIGRFPWKNVSKKLVPIAEKEVVPIVEDEFTKINEILSKSRLIVSGSDLTKELTSEERSSIMKTIMKSICRQFISMFSVIWKEVIKMSVDDENLEMPGNMLCRGYEKGGCKVKLRCVDNIAIFNIRREYSSKIASVLRNKFCEMLRDEHKFENNSILGSFSWVKVSRKLSPIVKETVRDIIEDEKKKLEEVLFDSRVVVDPTIDRKLENRERRIVLKNIVKFINKGLKFLCSRVWSDVISSSGDDYGSADNCITDKVSLLPNDLVEVRKVDTGFEVDGHVIMFCYDDDIAILNVKRKFSFEINRCIRNKFIEMLKNKCEFHDGTVIGNFPWKTLSKNILPIATREISPVIEKERIEINDVLLKSIVISCSSSDGCYGIARKLMSKERCGILEYIMKSIYRREIHGFSRIWLDVLKLQEKKCLKGNENLRVRNDESETLEPEESYSPLCLLDLREVHVEELDNIRLEFVGSLGPIIGEVVGSSPLDSSYNLEDMMSYVAERSYGLFKGGGFLDRVKLLLSDAMVSESGEDRLLTDREREYISQLFMDSIDSDMDYLIRKRTGVLAGASARPSSITWFGCADNVGYMRKKITEYRDFSEKSNCYNC
ncbi:hypothetical protein [Candidatus Ichthyocystis hellenicum]|uniref:hypothetical protein n=1 Tax=Candidatus Ichthyocystis hellenicum TaxID=1561003 RepID=UPI00111209A8|nr:hypothetical protein [Candidatus Ichthyocystis hellenicum]